jgi:hypothetical protein
MTPEIERRVVSKLRLPNATYHATYQRRLDDVTERLFALLQSYGCLAIRAGCGRLVGALDDRAERS